ncbi:hypothetical protein AKJ08_2879 [Vulgatibacter incomptus]|uniref:Uncharacterized protein n=2 Tax=Vulgatibacter incomptus TaxID=1391653 RepID=A0A0K1PG59_9BACT|nr:hypothetical protein AKJ08_2879 [Vulgatibacter incomptus]
MAMDAADRMRLRASESPTALGLMGAAAGGLIGAMAARLMGARKEEEGLTEHEAQLGGAPASERIAAARERASQRLTRAKERAAQRRGQVRERMTRARAQMPSGEELSARFQERAEEQLAGLLLGAVALGAAAAFLLPVSERERQAMAPARARAMEQLDKLGDQLEGKVAEATKVGAEQAPAAEGEGRTIH